jgi:hypothetical protein
MEHTPNNFQEQSPELESKSESKKAFEKWSKSRVDLKPLASRCYPISQWGDIKLNERFLTSKSGSKSEDSKVWALV